MLCLFLYSMSLNSWKSLSRSELVEMSESMKSSSSSPENISHNHQFIIKNEIKCEIMKNVWCFRVEVTVSILLNKNSIGQDSMEIIYYLKKVGYVLILFIFFFKTLCDVQI